MSYLISSCSSMPRSLCPRQYLAHQLPTPLPSIFQLCPIPFLPLPSINSAVHEWLLYDSAIFHQAKQLKCQEDIILTLWLPQQTNTHHFSVFRPCVFHQATILSISLTLCIFSNWYTVVEWFFFTLCFFSKALQSFLNAVYTFKSAL